MTDHQDDRPDKLHGPGGETGGTPPAGDVYDWYRRGLALLSSGDSAAAAQVLSHAQAVEPRSKSIREALARAQFNMRRYAESAETFEGLVAENPSDDYAHFGLGLALSRLGDHKAAAPHLAMAVAMRPTVEHYNRALRQVRAKLRASGGSEER
ncbi:MAG TPA: tetratricopeptide repeat protein [Actinopolymorphaceae bacterium]